MVVRVRDRRLDVRAVATVDRNADVVHPRDLGLVDVDVLRAVMVHDDCELLVAYPPQLAVALLQGGEQPRRIERQSLRALE